jgi:uncharacterized protein YbbC (DUF1343 family)
MKIGLERLPTIQSWGRCGLLCNQASVTSELVHSITVCRDVLKEQLVLLFSPQHGLDSTVQDNMIETGHSVHTPTGLPVYSLYSETREPTESMMALLDTIIIDIPIVGCRVYTFKWTIAACLRAAKKWNKQVVILDRPNPLGGEVIEGRTLDDDVRSFVGEIFMPMRHGLTVAEFAFYVNQSIGAQLTFVLMEGWDPRLLWNELGRPWVLTSPNLPTFSAVALFPGMVALEGTNLSEGRGTALPFQLVGAPFIKDAFSFVEKLKEFGAHDGLYLRPAYFQPTSQKWMGETCGGVHFVPYCFKKIRSYRLFLALIKTVLAFDKEEAFLWKSPPYEYDFVNLPIHLILGSHKASDALKEKTIHESFWEEGLTKYRSLVQSFLLYPRSMII